MSVFEALAHKSVDLQRELSKKNELFAGREILVNAQMHLYLQVAGKTPDNPATIPGGYFGPQYRQASQALKTCITLIEMEENLKALKLGNKVPFSLGWKY